MARKYLTLLVVGALGLTLIGTGAHAGEDALQKALTELNRVTGDAPRQNALKALLDNKKHAQELRQFALPAAKKKELSYNAALVLALTAAEQKDMKAAEVFFRVCMDHGAKLQSFEKLRQAYGLPIELYFENKQYADAARICKELLELNTDDGKDRAVIRTMTGTFGAVGFREEEDGFNTAQQLRPYIFEIYVKATAKQGKIEQAIKLVDGIIKKNDDWIDRQLKGWVLKEAGMLEDAAGVYEDVIKQVGKDTRLNQKQKDKFIKDFRYDVSNVYIEMKKIDKATEHLEFLLKKFPDNPVYYNDLGYILADNEMRLEEAEKMIRKALDLHRDIRKKQPDFDPKLDQDSGAFMDSLGWVLFKQKKTKEAKDWLIKALEDKSAQHIEIYDHLGDVHMALGEREAAIRVYEEGLKHVTDSRRDQGLKGIVEKKLAKLKGAK